MPDDRPSPLPKPIEKRLPQRDRTSERKGVVALPQRIAGQCCVCFKAIDARWKWIMDGPATSTRHAVKPLLLCDEHAEERMER